jgi:hypothetical protein
MNELRNSQWRMQGICFVVQFLVHRHRLDLKRHNITIIHRLRCLLLSKKWWEILTKLHSKQHQANKHC